MVLRIKNGDPVRFTGSIEALVTDLPADEAQAIREGIASRPFRFIGLMTDGTAEIELRLRTETHFFYVGADDLVLSLGSKGQAG